MSKILKFFGLKKKKHKINDERELPPDEDNIYDLEPDSSKNERGKSQSQFFYQSSIINSNDPCNITLKNYDRKIKSYPASPTKQSPEKRYSSNPHIKKGFPVMQSHASIPVYVTRVQNSSLMRKSNEPFPFQIPDDPLPRRSSMFYGVKYDDDMFAASAPEATKYPAEKPIEDYYNTPSTSKDSHSLRNNPSYLRDAKAATGRKVMINTPDESSGLENYDPDYQDHETIRKTVVRFRPHSAGSFSPKETVKQMILRAEQDPGSVASHVRDIPLKSCKEPAVLTTVDGRPLVPLEKDKITRRSTMHEPRASMAENTHGKSQRQSMTGTYPHRESQAFTNAPQAAGSAHEERARRSINTGSVAYVTAQRESIIRGSNDLSPTQRRESAVKPKRKSTTQPTASILHQSGRRNSQAENPSSMEESKRIAEEDFPYARDEQNVYAVPVVPTRGRSRSVLQQSVKSLISKNQQEVPVANRKNIRYSMDTDVFNANVRRRSVQQAPAGFVNMEKGQPVSVSEFLNPITSLFVSDLKDPVPKDPLTRPKEANIWVRPRSRVSDPPRSRQSVTKRAGSRTPAVAVPLPSRYVTNPSRNRRQSRYEDSDSEESFDMYRRPSRRSVQKRPKYQHQVYAAKVPEVRFPVVETSKNPPFKKKGKTSKDFCGLGAEPVTNSQCSSATVQNSNTHDSTEDEMDLLCYPSEKFLKTAAMAAESGTKLRWKIIIRKGELDDKT